MLTVYTDDSGNERQSPVFVLGGFVSTRERWEVFSEQWDRALAGPPRKLNHFKMVEANSLKGQFLGWSDAERNDKLRELAVIIRSNVMFSIRAILWWKDYDNAQRLNPDYPQEPYDILFHNIMALAVRHVMRLPVPETVEFMFDEQGSAGKRSRETFEKMKALLPPEWLAYVGFDPLHRSDREFLPLQAADMYAWQVRRFIADNEYIGESVEECSMSETMRCFDEIPFEEFVIDHGRIRTFFNKLRQEYPLKP